MKYLPFILCLLAAQAWARSSHVKHRVLKRKCESICHVFGNILESKYSIDGVLTEKQVKNILTDTIQRTGANRDVFVPIFLSNMDGIMKHVGRKEEGRKLCRKVKICRLKQYKGSRKSSNANRCKMCYLITSVVRDSIEILNTTFQSFGDLAEKSCNLFSRDNKTLSECLKIVEEIKRVENTFVKEPNPEKFCEAIGLCQNSSVITSRCVESFKSFSPWGTAFSLLRKGASLFVGRAEDAGRVVTSIRREPLFTHLKNCINDAWDKPISSGYRKRRSVGKSECPICDRLEHVLTSEIAENSKGLSNQLKTFCDKMATPSLLARCRVIVHLANTTSTIPQFMMSKEVCSRVACPKSNVQADPCEVCKKVQSIIATELNNLKTLLGMITEEVTDICKTFAPGPVGAKCQAISTMVDKIGDVIIDAFNIKMLCKKIGLC